MAEREARAELQELVAEIRRQTANWPSSMRAPEPGTDPKWERIISGSGVPDRNGSRAAQD